MAPTPNAEHLHEMDSLVRFLAERDVPCPACRYNLRGLQVNACPECGTAFELGLRGHLPGFGRWIFAIILTCVGLGFVTLLLIGGLIELLVWGFVTSIEIVVMGAFLLLEFAGIAQVTLLVRRRTRYWQRQDRWMMLHMVVGAILVLSPIAMILLFMF